MNALQRAVKFCATLLYGVALLCTPAQLLNAQLKPPPPGVNAVLDSARAIRGQQLELTLITYGPTDEVDERFGHDAIEMRDLTTSVDLAYNWGMFGYDQPGFYWNFLTGDTHYWMEAFPAVDFNQFYIQHDRTVRLQKLALTPVERAALAEYLAWNATEANKYYRYDYYNDNCATRARDAIDYVLKGRLKPALDTGTFGRTWRSETARVTASNYPVYAGIELALGRHADEKLTPWAESFMPERFADAIESLVLRNDEGQRYKIIAHDSIMFQAKRVPMPIDPPERVSMAALLGLTLAGIIAFLVDSRFGISRKILVTFVAMWYSVGGLLGTVLLLAGTVTKHAPYMGANITLWQLNPVLLAAAFVVPIAVSRRQSTTAARATSTIILLLSVFGLLLQLVPALAQHNGVVIAVILPVHFAIAAALWRMPRADRPRRVSTASMQRAA